MGGTIPSAVDLWQCVIVIPEKKHDKLGWPAVIVPPEQVPPRIYKHLSHDTLTSSIFVRYFADGAFGNLDPMEARVFDYYEEPYKRYIKDERYILAITKGSSCISAANY